MILDVSKLLSVDGSVKEVSFEDDICLANCDFEFCGPVNLNGLIRNSSGVLYLDATLEFEIQLNCYRCGENIKQHYKFDISEVFSSNKEVDDEDIRDINSKQIDLSPVIYENLLMKLPMKILCSEDCKGLCSVCGTNLNEKDCGCKKEYINPAFESLGNLFKK